MELIAVSDKVRKVLDDFVPGPDLSAKLESLTRASLKHLLIACNETLSRFEAKYGLTFTEFTQAWKTGTIPGKHSHEVERDFMEWEARQQEKDDLLVALREFDSEGAR
jgi:hypothetical protein